MKTKICSKCNTALPTKLFTVANTKTHKLNRWCKPCVKEYDRNRHKNQRTKIIAQKKARKQLINNWYFELKSQLNCTRCPENDQCCLTFHHTDPTEKETEVSQAVAWGWSKEHILNEMSKCIVLCFNCHAKLHAKQKQSG